LKFVEKILRKNKGKKKAGSLYRQEPAVAKVHWYTINTNRIFLWLHTPLFDSSKSRRKGKYFHI